MRTEQAEPILFLDDHRGIYIPRDFASCIVRERVTGIDAEDYAILENPDHEHYWDVWSGVCDSAKITDEHGTVYTIVQDGACWLVPEGMDFDERTESYFWASPVRVSLSNSDDDNGQVTVYCEDQRQARHDQSISLDGQGSSWECPRDMDCAYASLGNFYDLEKALTDAGYEVDASEYCAPDAEDLAYWSYRNNAEMDGDAVEDREAWLLIGTAICDAFVVLVA